ncbi:MAG: response regulator [Deltaproteobacteria bacterium]|nr:response regulator [Deltaproteobacteria bacterium]
MSRFKSLIARAKAALSRSGGSVNPGRVFLVVDDDPGARQTVVDYLESFGYKRVLQAANGLQAMEILEAEPIDLVVSDWAMPDADGLQLLKALKLDPRFKHIPFIMVTSPVSQERSKVENAAALKVDGYIMKPFRSNVLREKIGQAIAMANLRGRTGVLVVDDEKATREMIVEYLKALNFVPIFEAGDGSEGFAALQLHVNEIAFVISDWEMPKMAGIDLLRRIRGDAVLGPTPFIMVTSQTSVERMKVEQALHADVDNYLLKPFRIDDLRKKVEQVTEKAKAQALIERDLTQGEECLVLSKFEGAIKLFQGVLDSDAQNVRALVGMGVALRNLGTEKAIHKSLALFRKALVLNPQYDEAYVELALTFEDAKTADQAITVLREGLRNCVLSEKLHFQLGRLLLIKGMQQEGLAELYKALEIDPEFEEAQQLIAGK